ncbi:MAG: FAD-binding oxidoreductase [Gemmatimonadota bacterium]|nr:FAD-binding oxidoreductase [Gemmatimonadota bacterium]
MTHDRTRCDSLVIGGGFYGCSVALRRRSSGDSSVTLMDAGDDLMTRSSYANQARVHAGYHYPRSLLTGLRSRVNSTRFIEEYKESVVGTFDKYYAVARSGSNVSAAQFERFCERIGARLDDADPEIAALFDPDRIEAVYRVEEVAFDALALRERVRADLAAAGVAVKRRAEAIRVRRTPEGRLAVESSIGVFEADRVYNCTYSRCNRLLVDSGLPPIPLKHELTEMALVEAPEEIAGVGVTVMCGPFFSLMPFPARPGLHTLSHVRYTPHHAWEDDGGSYRDPYAVLEGAARRTRFEHMRKDAARYVPAVEDVRYLESLWEVKTVLPRSEVDDSRPILLKRDHGFPNLTCIMGSKIDNVYDVLECLEEAPA